jgi:hypothetical protein
VGEVKVWFDEEGDFLEVTFAQRPGEFREVGPGIYERVDAQGQVLGFAIFGFSSRARQPVAVPFEIDRLAAS